MLQIIFDDRFAGLQVGFELNHRPAFPILGLGLLQR